MMKPDYFLDDDGDKVCDADNAGGVIDFENEDESTSDGVTAMRRSGGVVKWVVLVVGVVLGSVAYLRYGTPFVSGVTDEVSSCRCSARAICLKPLKGRW